MQCRSEVSECRGRVPDVSGGWCADMDSHRSVLGAACAVALGAGPGLALPLSPHLVFVCLGWWRSEYGSYVLRVLRQPVAIDL